MMAPPQPPVSVQELLAEAQELTAGVTERLGRIQRILAGDEDDHLRDLREGPHEPGGH